MANAAHSNIYQGPMSLRQAFLRKSLFLSVIFVSLEILIINQHLTN
jgi:hypothetical protein